MSLEVVKVIEVNVHEAKTQLSKLLTYIFGGEEVTICRHGRPTARLVPCRQRSAKRGGGKDRGLFNVPDNFDDEVPEIDEIFGT
jgi:prevent-host-death family protein